jgi:group I intron endonuclease
MSGIYKIKNILDNKIYVGSAEDFLRRIYEHTYLLKKNKHHSTYLQNAWNKHGENSFIFGLIEVVEDLTQLIPREQHYIDTLKPEYNMCPTAGSRLGSTQTVQAIEKIRKNATKFWLGKNLPEETKKKIGDANRGNQHTQEAINKITINNSRYWKGKTRSTEAKEKMAKAKVKPISQYTLDGQFIRFWDSGKHVQVETGMSQGNINKVCLGKYKTAYGFVWKFN